MNWTRIFLFALLTLCVTGSISYAGMRGCMRLSKMENPFFALALQKAAVLAYTLPILFAVIFFRRAGGFFRREDRIIEGVFWMDRMKIDDKICLVLELVWLCGFVVELLERLLAQHRMNYIWRQNIPVIRGRRYEVFEQCRERFGLSRVELFENYALPSPVSAKNGSLMIVLPTQPYSEKELHMIFAHEMNHIRHRDLWWRRLMVIGSLLNWYHPWQRALEKDLIACQEIVCDLRASTGQTMFTQREYCVFLAKLSDYPYGNSPITALRESKHMTIRRIKAMVQAKKMKKPKGWMLTASCAGLLAAALLPASAVSAQVIAWEEGRIYASEDATQVEATELENSGEVHTAYAEDDPSVIEVDLTGEAALYSNAVNIDRYISQNIRVLIHEQSMSRGDKISIVVSCSNDGAVYRVGVKNMDTGVMKYVEGSGGQTFVYSIPSNGRYSAYVENRSNQIIKVTGTALYDD